MTKKSTTITYQSSGMLKASPVRSDCVPGQADHRPAADQRKPGRDGRDREEAAHRRVHQAHASGRLENLGRGRSQADEHEEHAADPDDDAEEMNGLHGRVEHDRASVRRGRVGALSFAGRMANCPALQTEVSSFEHVGTRRRPMK